MKRPYLNYSIQELENKFLAVRNERFALEMLVNELNFRTTPRAKKLKDQVLQCIATLDTKTVISRAAKTVAVTRPSFDFPLIEEKQRIKGDEDAIRTLNAWTALEVLSPQSFLRPEQLAQNGDRSLIKLVSTMPLPWHGEGEKSKPDYKLFYHIVLGTIRMPEAITAVIAKFPDSREERPVRMGEAVLASLLVNKDGTLAEEGGAAISSFGWGVANVLNGQLHQLGEWSKIESKLTHDFFSYVKRVDDKGNLLPVDHLVISQAHAWVSKKFGLPESLLKNAPFTIKVYHYMRNVGPPDPLLVNSFYLEDLTAARKLFSSEKATPNLRRYLGALMPNKTFDLLSENNVLEQTVAPQNFPSARWPGSGRHPLALLQQSAVNLSVNGLNSTGILPVNGPPGTGKTTLLRDVVAGLVTERARHMVSFDDPKNAFNHSGEKINVGSGWLHLYHLDERLKGYEMLVASSNNKAVENVSAELPALNAIATDAKDLRYFKTLSDAVHQKETWGMCAAVLGNALNRATFMQRFWWDKETGFRTYLAAASGKSQDWEEIDPQTGQIRIRTPVIIEREHAPAGPEQALLSWQLAREEFNVVLKNIEGRTAELAVIREKVQLLPGLIAAESKLASALRATAALQERAGVSLWNISNTVAATTLEKQRAETQITAHRQIRPGWLSRIFGTALFKQWQVVNKQLLDELSRILEHFGRQIKEEQNAKHTLAKHQQEIKKAEEAHRIALKRLHDNQNAVAAFKSTSGQHVIDTDFWEQPHRTKHLTSPWFNEADQHLRDDLFIAAMKVHKAFVDASAQYLRHNLGVFMMALSGKDFSENRKRALLPDLWSSLFLVVPCISTTFASVGRMMGDLPAQSLGYLIVDEAGQALPQAAVGALMRTKKAIVVGDPVQIEPVVSLPDSLTRNICVEFLVEADRYNAPEASVQTLSDLTSAYTADFKSANGNRSVGVPLLVHRRCAEPMFSISNYIGYGNQMVQSKAPSTSSIRDLFGPSRWFDISGQAQDKWCPKEGEWVLDMLRQLKKANITPNVYIISPFVIVADNLRLLIRDSGVLYNWVHNPEAWSSEHIGTVHTVQGREAEAVFFVLGAPLISHNGARSWAGSRPNLLNVAVTRAKEVIYVIGNRNLWKTALLFQELELNMSNSSG